MSRRISEDQAEALWEAHQLRPLESFPGSQAPWRSIHLPCGAEVAPRYSNVSKGQGACRWCSKHKPEQAKPGDAVCQVVGCEAPVFVKKRGLCKLHYHRAWRGTSLDNPAPTIATCADEGCTERATQGRLCPTHYRVTRDYGECSLGDCTAPAVNYGGYCAKHRRRADKHGSPDVLKRVWKGPDTCTFGGCDRPFLARGYCDRHYLELVRRAQAGPCEVAGCPRRADTAGHCARHYWRIRKFGDPHYTLTGDPNAVQLVYLVVHPDLQAVKIGVGHWWRVLEHLDQGWKRHREWGPLPRQDAHDIERTVLLAWRTDGLPHGVTADDMPQCGHTETAPLSLVDLLALTRQVDAAIGTS